MRISIMVTHLLGTGHLSRMLALAKALRGMNLEVQLISGGFPAAHLDRSGIDFVQLPPLSANGTDFVNLLDETGTLATSSYFEGRKRVLLDALASMRPDVAITELFPFGRRALSGEFEAALDTLKTSPRPPLIFASVRDVLAPPSTEKKALRTQTTLQRFYDGVLVHSDANVISLETSWPVTPEIAGMLHYTGFIAASGEDEPAYGSPAGEILVTAGGGPVGRQLFENAIGAARLLEGTRWRLLVGGKDAAVQCERFAAQAGTLPVAVEPVRADYRALLRRCAVAVGHCGYNTAVDWLQAGVPGVFVPFAEGGEVEQTIRARLLANRFGFSLVEDDALSPQTLASGVKQALQRGRRQMTGVDIDGAAESGRLLVQAIRSRN